MPRITVEPLKLEEINLFESSKGQGRDTNDERNKRREKILLDTHTGFTEIFFQDPTYGPKWQMLAMKLKEAEKQLMKSEGPFTLKAKGGRSNNSDFELSDASKKINLEFKFGGKSVDSIPEFFNPAADKPFHPELYARFFHQKYLAKLVELYGLTDMPTETIYMKEIHKNSSKNTFFKSFYDKDDLKSPLYKEKREIVAASITEFLTLYKDQTNLESLTAELQRSQENKHFLLYEDGKFYHDEIKADELIAHSILPIRNGNLLVIPKHEPGTQIEMLLRWKNRLGILFPAWQISMIRK
jgi:hypothetical protein